MAVELVDFTVCCDIDGGGTYNLLIGQPEEAVFPFVCTVRVFREPCSIGGRLVPEVIAGISVVPAHYTHSVSVSVI